MYITIVVSVLIVLGAALWAIAPSPKLQEAGRLMFFAGVLALALGTHTCALTIGGGR